MRTLLPLSRFSRRAALEGIEVIFCKTTSPLLRWECRARVDLF